MAEADAEETEETPKKKKKKIIFIIPVLLLVAGGGGGAYFMTAKKPQTCPSEETAASAEHVASGTLNGLPITLAASKTEDSHATTTAAPAAAEGDKASTENKDAATEQSTADAEFLKKCAEEAEAKLHGPIVRLTPITMNLSDGHILKVGLALQLVTAPEDEHLAATVAAASGGGHGAASTEIGASPLGGAEAKALNAAIDYLGNSTYDELSAPNGRAKAGDELSAQIKEIYHGDIVKVYFTDFVMS